MDTSRSTLCGAALLPLALLAGCQQPPSQLVPSSDAVVKVHTYGEHEASFTAKSRQIHRLRASCTGSGSMTVEVVVIDDRGTRTERGSVVRCPGTFEDDDTGFTPGLPVVLRVSGDASTVDGWAELVPGG
ncbi:hypothetical protein ACTQ49_02015 [Luteococcus sp. Sow4_B9]|uniref:hypothetical protein n=1 Tax=Luteococcus sp. Sow4_B9 TaxID=3438792 RepID=UPI003F97A280